MREPAGAAASVTQALRSTEVAPETRYRFRTIETLKPGDWVLAADERSGAVSPRRVLQTFVRRSDHLRVLDFEDASGSGQHLETTDEHPFWATDRRKWVNAGDLQPGDVVQGPHGQRLVLASTHGQDHADGIPVYNFEVDTAHTYFVAGPTSTAPPVLVHNANYADDVAPKGISNVPGDDFVPNPSVSKPYSRPSGAGPTAAQRAAVQGKPCVECGKVTPKQVADHIDPLSVQHYRDGAVDVAKQSKVEAVQPH